MFTKAQLIAFIRWYNFQPSTLKLHTPLNELIDFYFEKVERPEEGHGYKKGESI